MGSNHGADKLKKLMTLTETTLKNNERTQASLRVKPAKTPNNNEPTTL